MSRGRVVCVVAITAAILIAGWTLARPRAPASHTTAPTLREIEIIERELLPLAQQWIRENALARPDGFIYTIDLAQLITVLERSGDAEAARRLRRLARQHLICASPADPFTDGFVGWRFNPSQPLDASGTTEALRMIEALLESRDPDDAAVAMRIAHGYARHGSIDHDVWIIRNYFNFGTRAFATNTYLVDYDPDLLARLAEIDPSLRDVAERSVALVSESAAPCGLIYDIIQPEVVTLMPDGQIRAFSPNDIVQLANSLTVAERSVRTCPEIARGVLRFAVEKARQHGVYDLPSFYIGRTGGPIGASRAGGETLAGLVKLAILLDDREAMRLFAPALMKHAREFIDQPVEPRVYRTVEMLLAIQMLGGATATAATAPSSR